MSNYRPSYGPPGSAPPPSYGGAPAYGAPSAAPPSARPNAGFLNPSTGAPATAPNPAMYAVPGSAPAPGGYSPPPSGYGPPGVAPAGGPGFYAPPSPAGVPSGYAGPPNSFAPHSVAGSAGSGGFAPPPSTYGAPPSGVPAAPVAVPKTNVQFFSTGAAPSGGAPSVAPAPVSMGMPPPPTGPPMTGPMGVSMAGPPMGGAPVVSMPPPPAYSVSFGASNPATAAVPTGFDSMGGMSGHPNAGGAAGGGLTPGGIADGGNVTGGPSSSFANLDEVDLSIQCNPNFLRASVSKLVNSQAAANNARVPLGVICKPMNGDKGVDNEDIKVVDFGSTGIVRCKRCRTYINPYVTWTDNGRRWRCNICAMLNDVPSSYFSHLDARGHRRDRDQRPELTNASVEFIAPGDYMVRPPVPPVYFFLLDVSEPSISSGMIQHAVNAIKASLDDLPGNPRTQVGFITFDSHIHFYNLKSSLSSPQMLVVSDITDVIIPLPEDLLVNLQESRAVVDSLLDSLPVMFKSGSSSNMTCTGPALMAAKRVIQHIGGKLLLFQSSLPSIGEGSLKMRENPRLLGTDKEHTLLNADDPWYKTNAIEFSRIQVAVDTFLFSSQFTDVATISQLSKFTGGSTYYYPAFVGARDGVKFEKELSHVLTRSTAFEAVMRVRATRGVRFTNFYGNYFIRGTDLLALPNCTSDSTFALDLAYDEATLSTQIVTVQAALLYTNSAGERRIRVHTMILPVTNSVNEMLELMDIDCVMNLLAKQSIDIAMKTGLENARQRVHQTTVEMLRAAKMMSMSQNTRGMPGAPMPSNAPSALPQSLLLMPLYAMSLQKSLILRGGSDVRADERAFVHALFYNMDIEESKVFIYPRMFSLHDMSVDAGLPSDNTTEGENEEVCTAGQFKVRLPNILNLSYERLSSQGLFLLENGNDMFMWIGRALNPSIITTLFGFPSLDNIDMTQLHIIPTNSDFSMRVNAIVEAIREERQSRFMQLHFVREGDGYAEAYFARYLIEDRANFSGGGLSYTEYHAHVTRSMG